MKPMNKAHRPQDVRRDPRTGEAATDPTTSPANDPTHGVEPVDHVEPRTAQTEDAGLKAGEPMPAPTPAFQPDARSEKAGPQDRAAAGDTGSSKRTLIAIGAALIVIVLLLLIF